MDEAQKYVMRQHIAGVLDHPSVYMGGPSPQSLRKAIRIVEHLLQEYEINPKDDADAERVRTWRKSAWDSLERI